MRLIIAIIFLFAFTLGGSAQPDSTLIRGAADIDSVQVLPAEEAKIDSVLRFAESFIGCKYGYGSCGPKTFDCSGFVQHVYGRFGVELPHGSTSQKSLCKEIKLKKVKPGDLLFFAGRKISKTNIGHVAIVKQVNGEKITMIHATVQAGVISEVMQDSEYFNKRFIAAGRIETVE
jgi:cell wall-associated NlpC family hydrolase